MTLVLTVVCRSFVVQVSDRLVTANGKPHDPLANKSVVFLPRDAIAATLAYSGPAYLDGKTTDHWIAEALWGEDLGTRSALAWIAPPRWLDLHGSVHALRQRLEAAYKRLPEGHDVDCYIAVAGVERRGRHYRTLTVELGNYGDPTVFDVRRTPRELGRTQFSLAFNPYVLDDDERADLLAAVKDADGADDVEAALASAVRRVAARSSTVGADCMSVVIRPDRIPIRIRYLPEAAETGVLGEGALAAHGDTPSGSWAGTVVRTAYTPFLLSPGDVHFPSILVGTLHANLGPLTVALEGPDPGVPRFALSSLPRKPPPR